MKNTTLKNILVLGFLVMAGSLFGQDMTVTGSSDAASGLDLQSVGELFRNSEDAEAFERKLNDPATGINNMDLNEDGEVDYIRVVDMAEGDTHVLALQIQLSETEFQDVATIEIEKADKEYVVQIHGNVHIYGPNVYLRPVGVNWATVAFISWLYHPHYHPYISPYRFGYYPIWWRSYHPVAFHLYRNRLSIGAAAVRWNVYKASTVISARRVYIQPHPSRLVRKGLRHPVAARKVADRPRINDRNTGSHRADKKGRVSTQSKARTTQSRTTKTTVTRTNKKTGTTRTTQRTTHSRSTRGNR